jgi:hypothetical protein
MTLELERILTPVFTGKMHKCTHGFPGISQSVAASMVSWIRAGIAVSLICCIVPLSSADLFAQQIPPAGTQYMQLAYEQLNQLVAPIALYPDALVAQILAASTYPTEVADADRFVRQNAGMPHQELVHLVDTQAWDPSVKALTAFPSVLSNLARNLDWTSRPGNAYYNQPQDVMAAVQTMRQRAYAAGTLRSTPQESVVYQQGYIVIQPVNPAVVYVPVYNPVVVYGAPVPIYPTYAPAPPAAGSIAVAAAIGFAAGVAVGEYSSYHWGYSCWSPNWYSHTVVYNNTAYVSRSVTVVNHGYYGYYDHSAAARTYNQQVIYGPNGYASRTATTVGNQTNVQITGPNGTVNRSTSFNGNGNYSSTITGPNGQSVNRTVTGRGTGNVDATTSGPNGTVNRSTSFNGNGNYSSTIAGPNGQSANRTVTGRGTGNVNATTTGPNGTISRSTSYSGSGNGSSTTVTTPNGSASRGAGNTPAARSRTWTKLR